MDINEMVQTLEGLKGFYNKSRLLDVAEKYSKQAKRDDVYIPLKYNEVMEILKRVDEGDMTINDLLDDAINMVKLYNRMTGDVANPGMNKTIKTVLLNAIKSPLIYLQVIYIKKHPKYKSVVSFMGRGHNDPFLRAIGEMGGKT